jgi:hypothetical protein
LLQKQKNENSFECSKNGNSCYGCAYGLDEGNEWFNDFCRTIAATQDIELQREIFIPFSKSIYELLKVAKYEMPVYVQFCPMANGGEGANWLKQKMLRILLWF